MTLDGQQHTVEVPLSYLAYTMNPDSNLELQIVGSATAWLNLTQYGVINITDVKLELRPLRTLIRSSRWRSPNVGGSCALAKVA